VHVAPRLLTPNRGGVDITWMSACFIRRFTLTRPAVRAERIRHALKALTRPVFEPMLPRKQA
jgi:hypothetical protein